ncbi:MAG: hypothetical protein WA882_14540 [Geitlerinemataceae cyanobacterium]
MRWLKSIEGDETCETACMASLMAHFEKHYPFGARDEKRLKNLDFKVKPLRVYHDR